MAENTEKPAKKKGFFSRLKEMAPEEKAKWYEERRLKIARSRSNRKEEVREWKQETLQKLDLVIKENLLELDSKDVEPTALTLLNVQVFLNQGFSFLDIRDYLLANNKCTEIGWNKLKKALFHKNISNIEDLGLDIFRQQRESLEGIKTEIRRMKRMQKNYPQMYSKEIIDAYKTLNSIQTELTKSLVAMGAVGDKKKGGGMHINIFSQVPRPEPKEKEVSAEVINHLPRPTMS